MGIIHAHVFMMQFMWLDTNGKKLETSALEIIYGSYILRSLRYTCITYKISHEIQYKLK